MRQSSRKTTEPIVEPKTEVPVTAPKKRPTMLTFACPFRESKSTTLASEVLEKNSPSPPSSRNSSSDSVTSTPQEKNIVTPGQDAKSNSPSVTNKASGDTK